jgi:hypothetical protein
MFFKARTMTDFEDELDELLNGELPDIAKQLEC